MRKSLTLILLLLVSVLASAQVDRKDVRRGNRQFAKAKYGDADISYRKGLNADSTSVASAYNLGNNLYRQGNYAEAGKFYQQALRHVPETRNLKKQGEQGFDTYFNPGDVPVRLLTVQGIGQIVRSGHGARILEHGLAVVDLGRLEITLGELPVAGAHLASVRLA